MTREEDLNPRIRNFFEEIVKRVEDLEKNLQDMEIRLQKIEENKEPKHKSKIKDSKVIPDI